MDRDKARGDQERRGRGERKISKRERKAGVVETLYGNKEARLCAMQLAD